MVDIHSLQNCLWTTSQIECIIQLPPSIGMIRNGEVHDHLWDRSLRHFQGDMGTMCCAQIGSKNALLVGDALNGRDGVGEGYKMYQCCNISIEQLLMSSGDAPEPLYID